MKYEEQLLRFRKTLSKLFISCMLSISSLFSVTSTLIAIVPTTCHVYQQQIKDLQNLRALPRSNPIHTVQRLCRQCTITHPTVVSDLNIEQFLLTSRRVMDLIYMHAFLVPSLSELYPSYVRTKANLSAVTPTCSSLGQP